MGYNFDPHAEVTWLEDYRAVHIQWKRLYMSLEKFQEICGQAMQILLDNKASTWIANQYESEGAFKAEVQAFIATALYKTAQEVGIQNILTIMPKEMGLSSLSTKRWVNQTSTSGDINVVSFGTAEDCFDWIEEHINDLPV